MKCWQGVCVEGKLICCHECAEYEEYTARCEEERDEFCELKGMETSGSVPEGKGTRI